MFIQKEIIRPFSRRVSLENGDGFIKYLQIGNNDRWNMGVIFDAVRIKCIKAIDTPEKKFTTSAFTICAGIKFITLKLIIDIIVSNPPSIPPDYSGGIEGGWD